MIQFPQSHLALILLLLMSHSFWKWPPQNFTATFVVGGCHVPPQMQRTKPEKSDFYFQTVHFSPFQRGKLWLLSLDSQLFMQVLVWKFQYDICNDCADAFPWPYKNNQTFPFKWSRTCRRVLKESCVYGLFSSTVMVDHSLYYLNLAKWYLLDQLKANAKCLKSIN